MIIRNTWNFPVYGDVRGKKIMPPSLEENKGEIRIKDPIILISY